jgi:hypothetical protein
MAEITIQIPDELAQRLQPMQSHLPEVLASIADSFVPTQNSSTNTAITPPTLPLAFQEILDFLVTSPTPEAIIAFSVSPTAQERLRDLLERNRESVLTLAENNELNLYERLDHTMTLLKARAHQAQKANTPDIAS